MFKLTNRFNIWFDGLPEPRRFSVFIIIMLGWLVPVTLSKAMTTYRVGPELATVLFFGGGAWFVVVMFLALTRAFAFHVRRKG